MTDRALLEQAIAALEAQRTMLGDAVVAAAIVALQKQLADLEAAGQAGQRKLVTVLFADVVGFTAISETMDAEDVSEMMNALWLLLDAVVERHGGRIDKHIGDALMAIWGAGEAREDDPVQAVLAALEMHRCVAGFSDAHMRTSPPGKARQIILRIGVHTGPVLLGAVGLTQEFTAMGDTVNLASALQQGAPVGKTLISHDTFRHVQGVFRLRSQPLLNTKGKAEAVLAYLVEGVKERAFFLGTRGVADVETHMVGRTPEMERLQDLCRDALDRSRLRLVVVNGEAGIGKSRLVYEFERWVDLSPVQFWYFKGRSAPHSQRQPYALLRDMIAFRCQIIDSDPPEAVRHKLETWVGRALQPGVAEPDEAICLRAAFIGKMLGFDLGESAHLAGVDAQQVRDRSLAYVIDVMCALARQRPLLLILEDLHWADSSSLEAVRLLEPALREIPALILCAARPAFFERYPAGLLESGERLDLKPLSLDDCRSLVDELLQKAPNAPASLRDLIAARSDGIPYFVEELFKMFIDEGVILPGEEQWRVDLARLDQLHVPASLTALLQARLDRLSPDERLVMQCASVVGRVFWESAVVYLNAHTGPVIAAERIEQALASLRRQEMIFPRKFSAFAGSAEFIFKHALLREVTYEGVLRRTRKTYHALAARWLIEQSSERQDEFAGLIAEHFEQAQEVGKAIDHLQRAAQAAAGRYAHTETTGYLNRLLALLPEAEVQARWEALIAKQQAQDALGLRPEQRQTIAALERLAIQADSPAYRAQALLRRAYLANALSDQVGTIETCRQALIYAELADDWLCQADTHRLWGMILWLKKDYLEAQAHGERALSLVDACPSCSGVWRVQGDCLRLLGIVSARLGDEPAAEDYFNRSLALARQTADHAGERASLNSLGFLCVDRGDYLGARRYYHDALALARQIGNRRAEQAMLGNLGVVSEALGDWRAAQDYYLAALKAARLIDDRRAEMASLNNLGDVLVIQDEPERAAEHFSAALALAVQDDDREVESNARYGLGKVYLAQQQYGEARSQFELALTMRAEIGLDDLAVEARAALARLALVEGDLDEARRQVGAILEFIDGGGSLYFTQQPLQIYLTCVQVLQAMGDGRAAALLEFAVGFLQERAEKIRDETARQNFLASTPIHGEIQRLWEKNNYFPVGTA